MKRSALFILTLAAVLYSAPLIAAELSVIEAVVTTEIRDREPVDSVQGYPAGIERLYCFTRVVGAEDDTFVTHVWYFADEEMAQIELPVRSSDWRTWSSKSILPAWAGDWRVDVVDPAGNRLASVSFVLN